MNKFTKYSASFLMAVASVASAVADESASKAVNYSDLNVSSAQGAAALYARINAAARSVCNGDDNERQLELIAARESCIRDAVTAAVRRANNESLSSYYSAKTGHAMANMAANTVQ